MRKEMWLVGAIVLVVGFAAPPVVPQREIREGELKQFHGHWFYRTANFIVRAPSAEAAFHIGDAAERSRKEQAMLWLGKELPVWESLCQVEVKLSLDGSFGGSTTFAFSGGKVVSREMNTNGKLDTLLANVLPHEITHTIFADYYGCPPPRWADEGGAVLAEDAKTGNWVDNLARQVLKTPGRAIPLRRLFSLKEFPRDLMVFYAEGYSVTRFFVNSKDRKTFLSFVRDGLDKNWDRAVRIHYGYADVQKLEEAWLKTFTGKASGRLEAEKKPISPK